MDWNQLKTILWLRWRLSRNQWSRGGQVNAVLTMVIFVIGLVVSTAAGIISILIGALALSKASPNFMLVTWDIITIAFLFIWMIGLITELQRSETIDIGRMLHLPVFLRDIFIVNYIASHLTFSIILFLPIMVGLSIGLIIGRNLSMILMLPLVLGFIFMITAWTYCLRGWLVALMVNKRRRRAIIAGITFGFILLSQLPNLLGNFFHDRNHRKSPTVESVQSETQTRTDQDLPAEPSIPESVLIAHRYVPFLWVGNGAMTLAQGHALSAILGAAGVFAIGGLGLRRAYRSTLRFYSGQASSGTIARKQKEKKTVAVKSNFLEKELLGISNEASAMGLAFFRSLMRAPEIKMMLATNLLIFLFFGATILLRRASGLSDAARPFIATGAVVVTFFGLSQLMFNLFGADRIGFRMLVLTPTKRELILLGKNLAYLPIALIIGLILLIFVKFAVHIPVIAIGAAVFQLIAAFLLISIAGNLISIYVPYRIAPGSMKPTKTSTLTTLMLIVSRLLFPVTMIPVFLAPLSGWLFSKAFQLPAGPVNLIFSAVILSLVILMYKYSLAPFGRFLQQQEKKILEIVTREIE